MIDTIVKKMVESPKYIPSEVQDVQFRIDYNIAFREFRIIHHGETNDINFTAKWISNYMKNHYGYKKR